MMTVQEFAAKYKATNPKYAHIDDLTLAQDIVRDYPDYESKIDFKGMNRKPVVVSPAQTRKEEAKKITSEIIKQQKPGEKKGLLQKASDISGKALKTGSDLMFGSTSKTAGGLISRGIGSTMDVVGGITGNKRTQEIGQKLVSQNSKPATKTDIAFTALELYPGGGLLGSALKKLPGGVAIAGALFKLPEGIIKKAIKQYSEALGATTKPLKEATAKVVPQLLEKRVSGGLNKIQKIAKSGMEVADDARVLAESKIPETAVTKTKPILEKANKLKNSYMIDDQVFDEGAVNSIETAIKQIEKYGKEIPDQSLIRMRKLLDRTVYAGNKNLSKDEGMSLALEAKKSIADTMRGILNGTHVDLGAANKEFTLWKNVGKIVDATIERRSTQAGGLTKFIAPLLTTGSYAATGNLIGSAVAFFGTQQAIKLFTSPAYKTISAVNKARLADLISSGKIKEATYFASKLLTIIKNEVSK